MRQLKFFILIVTFIFHFIPRAHGQIFSEETNPVFVRIRMFKELANFPIITNVVLKRISKSVWSASGDNLNFQNKKLPAANVVLAKPDGKFEIISLIPFSDYIAGVVSNEMPTSWPLEALKAQAVVARSFALARIKERQRKYFHLDSDQTDQVYSVNESARAYQAVFETDGLVLQTPTGKVLKAYYHADCGGQTVKASEVWGAKVFDSGVATDSWCANRNSNKWEYEISKSDFATKLGIENQFLNENKKLNIENKTQWLILAKSLFSVQKIRQLLGFSSVRSTPSQIEITPQSIKISGRGYGHGAGLCQWGSLAQAKMGKDYQKILEHYYPNAKLNRESIKLSLNLSQNWPENRVSN